MEMYQIRYFLALSETLNFTKAAEKCNVSQPALTRAVKKLEEELGGALVVRERSQTHLTELGRIMLPQLSSIMKGAYSAMATAAAFHGEEHASVRLALSKSVDISLVSAPLKELARVIPELEIKLFRDDGKSIVTLLQNGEVDIIVAGDLQSNWDRLEQWTLFTEGFSLLVPTQHELSNCKEITVDQIKDLDLMPRSFSEEASGTIELLMGDVTTGQKIHETPTEGDLAAFVALGLGFAIAPDSVTLPDTITRIPIAEGNVNRSVHVYGAAGRQRSPSFTTLIKQLRAINWLAFTNPSVAI